MSRFYDEDFNPLFKDDNSEHPLSDVTKALEMSRSEAFIFRAKPISDLIRKDRDDQDKNMDSIIRNSFHRREIMMAKKIIDENTLCLAGLEPCESCQRELDNE